MAYEPYLGRDIWPEDWVAVFPNTDSMVVQELHILRVFPFALKPPQDYVEDFLPTFGNILPPLGKIVYRNERSIEATSEIDTQDTLEEMLRDAYGSDMVKRLGEERVKALIQILWESGGVLFRRKIMQMCSGLPASYRTLLSSNFRVCVYYFLGSALLGDKKWNCLFDLFLRCFLWGNPPLQKTPKNEFVVVTC